MEPCIRGLETVPMEPCIRGPGIQTIENGFPMENEQSFHEE